MTPDNGLPPPVLVVPDLVDIAQAPNYKVKVELAQQRLRAKLGLEAKLTERHLEVQSQRLAKAAKKFEEAGRPMKGVKDD